MTTPSSPLPQHDPLTQWDVPSPQCQLFSQRRLLLFGEIQTELAKRIVAQLWALGAQSDEPIQVLLNSPGGHVESADSIFDVIRALAAPVYILGTGWVASAGALIFVSVPRERRLALPQTRFMLHQPLGGVGGPASDIEIEAAQISQMRSRLNETFSEATGQPIEQINKDTDRNYWLTTQAAIEYGLLGRVVGRFSSVLSPSQQA